MDIYPAIDIKDGKCVRLTQGRFDAVTEYSDDPVAVAAQWQAQGAHWLHVVNLDGARTGDSHDANVAVVTRIIAEIGLPVQFGGGMRTPERVQQMLDKGVQRVVVGTTAAQSPKIAEQIFAQFGDRVAVGVDAREGMVAVQGWQEHIGETATMFVQRMAQLGARRFIFTDIGRDGMLKGINAEALAQVAASVPHLPVIASGGVTTLVDLATLHRLRTSGTPNIEGAIIGKALYAGTLTLPDALAHTI